jgi:hypothetical protein
MAVHDGVGVPMASPRWGVVGGGKRIGNCHFRGHPPPGLPPLGGGLYHRRNFPGNRLRIELVEILVKSVNGALFRHTDEVANPLRVLKDVTRMHEQVIPRFGEAE